MPVRSVIAVLAVSSIACSGSVTVGSGDRDPPQFAGSHVTSLDRQVINDATAHAPVEFTFAVSPDRALPVRLERFRITTATTRFVLGSAGGRDTEISFDPESVTLLRGHVIGLPESRVFLAMSDHGTLGRLELGPGEERFQIGAHDGAGQRLPADQIAVYPVHGGGVSVPHAALCGVNIGPNSGSNIPLDPPSPGFGSGFGPRGSGISRGRLVVETAVETDYELFQLFGDTSATLTYVMQLYAAISDIFEHDINTGLELTFVRVWDDPNDLFNAESPLGDFRSYWNDNMGSVHRDVAQFCSGRRNMPFGGQAWLDAICNDRSYSVTAYNLGFFVDPSRPHVFNRDIHINAHELGHNFDALHTHNYDIDTCDEPTGVSQRGTIMSYCSQTRSGGDANTDLRFDARIQQVMRDYIATQPCPHFDCNGNGIDDADDISAATSSDVNGNDIPDECEDCNGNGTLDDADISGGASDDLNSNGIPDECEPDCNGNGLPDDMDLIPGETGDLDANGVPDECQTDCDGDGTADYLQIQADMSLDIDRDLVLDSCADCDGDGQTDLAELNGALNVWVGAHGADVVQEFHALTAAPVNVSATGSIGDAQDLIITPDARVLVSSSTGTIREFDRDGAFVGDFVTTGQGLVDPAGLTFGAVGGTPALLVAERSTDQVLAFDLSSGNALGAIMSSGLGGLVDPFGLVVRDDGRLLVTSNDGRVIEYDAAGGLIGDLVTTGDNGGLTAPRGMVFAPDGRLLVCSKDTNQVLAFDGSTGAFLTQFNNGGTADRLTMDEPWGIRIGPDGDVYVARHGHPEPSPPLGGPPRLHLTEARIYHFDGQTGWFIRATVVGNDTGLDAPTGFDFMPGDGSDCNANYVPDDCDLLAGTSFDCNSNGIPDECENLCPADFDCNGFVNTSDFVAYLNAFTSGNPRADLAAPIGTLNTSDFVAFLNLFVAGCQ